MPAGPQRVTADFAKRLTRLEDIEAIRTLIASYGPLADAGDAAGVAALWEDDGEYDVGGYGAARGRAAIAALIDSETHRQLMTEGCAHVLAPHRIEVDGDEAFAEGYSMVLHYRGDGLAVWRASTNHWWFARQTGGGWRTTRRVNRPIGPRRP